MIWFKFYSSWGDGIKELSDEEAGRFIKAICRYAETGKAENPSGVERILFAIASKQIQQDAEHAKKVSSARAESGRLGGLVSSGSKQMQANEANDSNCKQMQTNALIKNEELRTQNQEQRIKRSEQEEELNAPSKKAETKHRHGTYGNVLLTDEQYQKLKEKFPDAEKRIEDLSFGIASKGYQYKDHYATILNWARKDEERQKPVPQKKQETWLEIAERLEREEAVA